jgi:hypothetical protein
MKNWKNGHIIQDLKRQSNSSNPTQLKPYNKGCVSEMIFLDPG